ncbi:LOW QUALITY PROTEIN: cyclin N-terminal domain-containing protein 1-like [Amphiura filiformis]|uniref:LOW QUALITY PROTEIN: cyclin N-terminal domain-containing protein 1-like n=1 Tax=Amphiura filiformis TaxID=82378 RepID=UPI003B20D841
MAEGGIFGSPPEPAFNDEGCLPLDVLEDVFLLHAKKNEEVIHQGSSDDGSFKHGTWSETIFLICKKFQQPAETRYLAVEIFDRFMITNLKNLHQPVDKDRKWCIPVSVWNKSSKKCKKRILLYMLSCVQVASKMCSHKRILSCRRCCEFLRDAGVFCSRDLVLDCELCVLKTLNYKIHVSSPVVYIEALLEIIGRSTQVAGGQLRSIHGTSLQVLDLVYLKRNAIYSKLYEVVTGDVLGSTLERGKTGFLCVEKDAMLLAACVIAAATYILDRTAVCQVIGQLYRTTNIPQEDIIDFSTVLVVYCLS